jgi:DNA-binding beta-propeller fold protein YncE
MKNARLIAAGCAAALAALSTLALADRFPQKASFTTLAVTPFAIEGLTGDAAGNLYTTGRQLDGTKNCPIWRFDAAGARVTVAFVPNRPASAADAVPVSTSCNPSGITFDAFGKLYVADSAIVAGVNGVVWQVTPHPKGCPSDDSADPRCALIPSAAAFATNVPGTNGLAFDRHGNLWTGDGTTGVGRVWKIHPRGGDCEPAFVGCVEAFRIQAMANVLIINGAVVNVGRDARTLPPGTINAARTATNTLGSQPLVANGLAFTPDGDLYVADTARGAIWKVEFDRRGDLKSRQTGCDETFPPNTLCLENIFVAHPFLEGTDGIALDRAGNIWNSANERNAIVVVTKEGSVLEVFRNRPNKAGLRNSADTPEGISRIVEFPTSPFLSGKRFCTSNSDGDRRDNSPRAAGEINAGNAAAVARGKISCMDQRLEIPGLPLPVH